MAILTIVLNTGGVGVGAGTTLAHNQNNDCQA